MPTVIFFSPLVYLSVIYKAYHESLIRNTEIKLIRKKTKAKYDKSIDQHFLIWGKFIPRGKFPRFRG